MWDRIKTIWSIPQFILTWLLMYEFHWINIEIGFLKYYKRRHWNECEAMYLNKQESYINTSLRDSKRTYTQFCRSQTHPYGPLIIIACIGRCIVNLQYIVLVHVITSEIRVPICHNKEIITPFICITRNNGTPLCIVTCSIKGTNSD